MKQFLFVINGQEMIVELDPSSGPFASFRLIEGSIGEQCEFCSADLVEEGMIQSLSSGGGKLICSCSAAYYGERNE